MGTSSIKQGESVAIEIYLFENELGYVVFGSGHRSYEKYDYPYQQYDTLYNPYPQRIAIPLQRTIRHLLSSSGKRYIRARSLSKQSKSAYSAILPYMDDYNTQNGSKNGEF